MPEHINDKDVELERLRVLRGDADDDIIRIDSVSKVGLILLIYVWLPLIVTFCEMHVNLQVRIRTYSFLSSL